MKQFFDGLLGMVHLYWLDPAESVALLVTVVNDVLPFVDNSINVENGLFPPDRFHLIQYSNPTDHLSPPKGDFIMITGLGGERYMVKL
jgi:hypothetical protein